VLVKSYIGFKDLWGATFDKQFIRLEMNLIKEKEETHHVLVVVGHSLFDLVQELLLVQNRNGLKTLVRQGGLQIILTRVNVVDHGKVDVAKLDQIGVKLDYIQDVLSRKSVGSQSFLDLGKNLLMGRIVGVQNRVHGRVFISKTIQEMLGENPSHIAINGFLDCFFYKCLI
jgi:hypothetical protein